MYSKHNLIRVLLSSKNKQFSAGYHISKTLNATNGESNNKQASVKQKTALYDFHVQNNAKIVDFAGWLMPVIINYLKNQILVS